MCTSALVYVRESLKALKRIRNFLPQNQGDHLYMAYISKMAHNLIDKTHHKALYARFNTFNSTFEELFMS